MKIIPLDPVEGREEWLAWRRGGVGGSDVAALVGLSRFDSPMSLYLDKVGMLDDSQDGATEAMRWGSIIEPLIAREFEERTGLCAVPQVCVEDDEHPHRRATIDALVTESPASPTWLGTLEIKVSGAFGFDAIPDEYMVQCQWQLGLAGLTTGWLAVLLNGRRLVIVEIDFDPAVFAGLCRVADRFWNDNVLARVPPPADASPATTEALKDAYRDRATGATRVFDDDLADTAVAWVKGKAAVKVLKEHVDGLENQLRASLQTCTAGVHGDDELVTWKPQRTAARVDLDGLKLLYPDIAKELTGPPGATRVMRATKALRALAQPEDTNA